MKVKGSGGHNGALAKAAGRVGGTTHGIYNRPANGAMARLGGGRRLKIIGDTSKLKKASDLLNIRSIIWKIKYFPVYCCSGGFTALLPARSEISVISGGQFRRIGRTTVPMPTFV